MVIMFNITVIINLLNGEVYPCLCSKYHDITGNAGHSIPQLPDKLEHPPITI